MRKTVFLIFVLVLLWSNNTFSANTYDWNLNYNNNTIECLNQSRNDTSGTKYIPKVNNFSAPTSANADLCESYWFFWWVWSSWYPINNNYTCPSSWYASILERRNSDTEYRVKCKTRFDDTLVELDSAPLQDKSIIADWQNKNVEISFPLSSVESDINYIDFIFIVTDNTSIDWLTKNKNTISSSVVTIEDTTTDSFTSQIRTVTYRLINGWNLETMKSWDKFNFIYKFYNPTEVATDIFPAISDWFIYNTIKYDIVFTDWGSINWYYVEDKADNTNINSSTIPVKLKPLIELNNTWILIGSGFVEWTTQTWWLDIINNNWSVTLWSAGLYLSMTWSITKPEAVDYFTWTWNIDWWTKQTIDKPTLTNIFLSDFTNWLSYVLETLFTLVDSSGWYIDDIKDIRLREFVKYTIWGKTITYLVWVLNQTNSNNFETLKIYWKTNISDKKQKDLVANQDSLDIQNLAWNITKASLKRDIKKRAINTIKFIDTSSITLTAVNDITNNSWDNGNWGKILWKILFYNYSWVDVWKNAIIWDWTELSITWRKTLIVRWWNIRIKSNIINTSSSDILWIIVLKDDNWNWGKVYIDSSVDEVDAVIYADKSIIWYNDIYDNWDSDSIIKHEIDWNINNNILDNQLYIYWSVFTENTIWASRIDPPVCPFWTTVQGITCNTIEAQKYDFNYLRTWLWVNPKFVPISWNNYPVVIKYNSSIQSTPPPLFGE